MNQDKDTKSFSHAYICIFFHNFKPHILTFVVPIVQFYNDRPIVSFLVETTSLYIHAQFELSNKNALTLQVLVTYI